MALIKCPNCGITVSDQADACMKCKYPIKNICVTDQTLRVTTPSKSGAAAQPSEPLTKYCTNCGRKIDAEAKFCPECGNRQQVDSFRKCESATSAEAKPQKSVDVSKGGKRLVCILISAVCAIFLLAILSDSSKDISTPNEPTLSKSEYIERCKEINYKELFRYSESYESEKIKIVGRVSQILTEGGYTVYKVSTLEEYGLYYEDDFCVFDNREDDGIRILEGDIIEVYGVYDGLTTWEYAISKTEVEVPTMYAVYIDLIEE